MTSSNSSHATTKLLLESIPAENRHAVVRQILERSKLDNDITSLSLAASLLDVKSEASTVEILLENINELLVQGRIQDVRALFSQHPSLKHQILSRSIELVSRLAEDVQKSPIRRQLDGGVKADQDEFLEVRNQSESLTEIQSRSATLYLALLASTKLESLESELTASLFTSCLILVDNSNGGMAKEAHRILLNLLDVKVNRNTFPHDLIWARIQSLIAETDADLQTFGFSLWLHWIIVAADSCAGHLRDVRYWQALVRGLRIGDSEKRKAALQILRASIEITLTDPSLLPFVVAERQLTADVSSIRQQYARFCTVFEAIVLGRYLNQVQQCEPDLDFLISTQSVIKPVWLYTLLGCALDQKMQDSNRKFIGGWILKSDIRSDDHESFMEFFRTSLLPWATQGYLFTTTLRHDDNGQLRCRHGDKLSGYVMRLMASADDTARDTFRVIFDHLLSKANNNFAYSMVHLIEGVGRALEMRDRSLVDSADLERANKIIVWAGLLPEVARDFVVARLWKMCFDLSRSVQLSEQNISTVSSGASLWSKVLEKAGSVEGRISAQISGPISALTQDMSRRDVNEAESIQKCLRFKSSVSSSTTTTTESLSAAEQIDLLDDLWSDLEYLEYPKGLLIVLPTVILDEHFLAAASSSENEELKDRVRSLVYDLLKQAEGRSYLLSPLLQQFRQQVFRFGAGAVILNVEDFVVDLAENPPAPTLDAQLENATAALVASISPELACFDQEFYFGKPESYGFAAFLDLVARLGATDVDIPRKIAARILKRWVKQRTPVPTVSQWKSTLQLQVLLICLEQHLPHAKLDEAKTILQDLQHVLSIEPLPGYRYMLEWAIARVHWHHADLRSLLCVELRTKDHHSNPKFLASLMKIGVAVAKTERADESFALELATTFVALAASSKVVIRHEAQWQVPVLLDHATARGWPSVSENTALRILDEFVRSLERFGDPPIERQIDKLDLVADSNLTHLVEGSWHDLDSVEARQTSHECFLGIYEHDEKIGLTLPASCLPLGHAIVKPDQRINDKTLPGATSSRVTQNVDNISQVLGKASSPATLQTKGNAYLESARKRHEDLLVVASLVDNPYNLGGLSRVSEIFGAGALYVPSTNVTSSRDFTGVSVSSHLHFPIRALPAAQLHEFLLEKKQSEGFAVVGIEQTDRSVLLGSSECVLPRKCILVMGSEKEGIPAMVLSACDVLVEIRQIGITRSLNVQTAAGIVLCEYARQHEL